MNDRIPNVEIGQQGNLTTQCCCVFMQATGTMVFIIRKCSWQALRRTGIDSQAAVIMQAMGSSLLPRLWRWLAVGLGLPLEAPMEATRGWDIASLQMGLHGVAPSNAALFGLFCRYLLRVRVFVTI